MTGKPSQFGKMLINELCNKHPTLENCCMAGVISSLWRDQLPTEVKTAVANHSIVGKDVMKDTFELADSVFASLQPAPRSKTVAAIARAPAPAALNTSADEPALQMPVAAYGRGGRGNRGTSRGRGGGNWYQRGGAQAPRFQQQRPQQQQQGQPRVRPNKPEDRHPDGPPETACYWQFGRQATFCRLPMTCPWKDIIAGSAKAPI